jgi:hypothetical protein
VIPNLPLVFAQLYFDCHSIVIAYFDLLNSSALNQIFYYSNLKPYFDFFVQNNQPESFQLFFEILFEKEVKNEGQAPRNSLIFTFDHPHLNSLNWILNFFPNETFFQFMPKIDLVLY